MNANEQLARRAGLLNFLSAVVAPIVLMYVPGKLFVTGNPAATAAHLRSSQGLLRLGIASKLLGQVIAIFVVLTLYRLFKPVDFLFFRVCLHFDHHWVDLLLPCRARFE